MVAFSLFLVLNLAASMLSLYDVGVGIAGRGALEFRNVRYGIA